MAGKPVGTIFAELDLDATKYDKALRGIHSSAMVVVTDVESNFRTLGTKSSQYFDLMRAKIENAYQGIVHSAKKSDDDIVRAEKAKNDKLKELDQEQFGTQTSLIDSLKANWISVSATIVAALYTIKKGFDLAELGAKVKSIEESFTALAVNAGIAGDALISELKKVTAQTVDSSDLMLKANRLIVEGFSAEQIIQVGEAARVAARLMGTDVTKAYESVTDAIVNLRQRGLKTAGFVIDLNEAYREHADKLGIAASSLNDYGKMMALQEAVYKKTIELQKQVGIEVETTSEKIQKQKAVWKDFWDTVGKAASEGWALISDLTTRAAAAIAGMASKIPPAAWGGEASTIEGPEASVELANRKVTLTQKEQQSKMDQSVIDKQRLDLQKQMLQVGTQTLEKKIEELKIDEQLALSELARYGNTGELIEQTKRLYEAKAQFLIQQEQINNLTENAEKMAKAEADAEKTRQDLEKTYADWKIKYLEKELSAEMQIIQVKTQQQKLEEDRMAKISTAQTGTAVALGYMRPGQATLQNIGFQQADIAGQIDALRKQKDLVQETIDLYTKEGIPLTDIETKMGRIRDIDNEIYKLETQSLVLEEEKKKQISETASAFEGLAAGFQKYITSLGNTYEQLSAMTSDIAQSMESSFSNFFQSIFDNTKSWKDKMKGLFDDLANSFIKALSDMAAKWLVTQAVTGMTGLVSTAATPTMSTTGGTAYSGISAGEVSAWESSGLSTVYAYQSGGFAKTPQIAKLAEHEPEYVIPQSKMDKMISKEQSNQPNANIFYIQAMDPLSFREFVRKNPEAIIEVAAKDARGAGAMRSVIKGIG